ncbi:hypothetical protein MASR1M60_19560 [Rhodocyclaceae bacterium]
MKQTMRVLGCKRGKGVYEGTPYDYTRLRVEVPVPRNSENESGCACEDVTVGKHADYETWNRYTFPGEFIVDAEISSRGLAIYSIEPVAKAVKAA